MLSIDTMTKSSFVPRPQTLRNSVHSSLHLRFITLVNRKCSCMRKPDACSLLTSWHLLCPNCPLVLFLLSLSLSLSLSLESYEHRKLHPARPLVRREQVPRAHIRTHIASLASFSLHSSLFFFLFSLACFALS